MQRWPKSLTRLMISTVVVGVSLVAVAAAQPAGTQLVPLGDTGLTIGIPQGWTAGGVSGASVLAAFAAGSGLYPNFSATLEDASTPGALHEHWLGLIGPARTNETEERTVAGHPALFADVSWSSPLGDLRAVRLLVDLGDQVAVLTFVDRAGDVTEERAAAYRGYLGSVSRAR